MILPKAARYFPLERGIYEVSAGLKPFGKDFSNGMLDRALVQIDENFAKYRENKIRCRREDLKKYYCTHELSAEVMSAATELLVTRLTSEYPQLFHWETPADARLTLKCELTGERLYFAKHKFLRGDGSENYVDALDALASQIPEDICVISTEGSRNWLSAVHLCSAGHWAPAAKIGLDFAKVHAPVPGIERISEQAASFVDAMINKGPFVRFVWGFATDDRLNHHPDPPHDVRDPETWHGRSFREGDESFFIRVERQVTWGLSKVSAALFSIRVYYLDARELSGEERARLLSAVQSMSRQALDYKGLAQSRDAVIKWLSATQTTSHNRTNIMTNSAPSPANHFLGIESIAKARVAVIQAPLENTTSFQHGTAQGPQAFLRASQQLETFDIESGLDFSTVGVSTFRAPDFRGIKNERALEMLEAEVTHAIDHELWPLTVGGEHTVSLAPIRALKKKYPKLSVLQIDAHADLRDSYEGSPLSHACVMRRVAAMGVPFVSFGVRSYSEEEAQFVASQKIPIFHAHNIFAHGVQAEKVSAHLGPDVYISVDIDGFSPEECPGTGTPEPGGITWWQGLELFRDIFKKHNVVGADIVEIMPLVGSAQTEFFSAKLAYKMIGMKFFPATL